MFRSRTPGGWSAVAWWLPAAVATLYVVLVLLQIGTIVHQIWWDSDSSEAGVFAQLYGTGPPGTYVSIGYHGWFVQLAFMLLTRSWPAHRLIWYAAPIVVAWVGLAAVGYSALRCFGRLAAGIAVAALVVGSVNGMYAVLQPTAHGPSIAAAALVCAGAVWVLPRARSTVDARLLAVAVALGVIGGLPLAGDSLYLIWGALPLAVMVAAFVYRSWREGRREAAQPAVAFAVIVLVLNALVAKLLAAFMHGKGFHTWHQGLQILLTFSTPLLFVENVQAIVTGVPWMYGGYYFGEPIAVLAVVKFIAAAIVLVGVWVLIVKARRAVARLIRELPIGERVDSGAGAAVAGAGAVGGGAGAAGGGTGAVAPELARARLLHVSFWLTAFSAGLLSFLFGNPLYAGTIGGIGSARYLVGPVVAAGALIPWLMRSGRIAKVAVAAAVAVLGVTACILLETTSPSWYRAHPSPQTLTALRRFAAREHVSYGYGPYWDTVNVTWFTGFRLQLFPIRRCGPRFPIQYCASPRVSMYSWYRPRPGIRSMLIRVNKDTLTARPPASWGKPIAERRFGWVTVWVFPFDIAEKLNDASLRQTRTNTLPPVKTVTIPLTASE